MDGIYPETRKDVGPAGSVVEKIMRATDIRLREPRARSLEMSVGPADIVLETAGSRLR